MMMKMPQLAVKNYLVQERYLFHCKIRVKIPEEYGEELLDDCFGLLETIDRKYNSYQKGSYFDLINQNAGQWTNVDETTISLLQKTIQVSEITGGTYDITVMPLIRLWGFYADGGANMPSSEFIIKTLRKVDYKKIQIDGTRVKLEHGQEIITGSFIKAFAVDQLIKKLKEESVTNAIVNAGGSTIFALANASHPAWYVNLPDPTNTAQIKARLPLANACFSMSATGNNFVQFNGKRYSHILNARTGQPSSNLQAGVITDDALTGDLLSTVLFCLPPAEFESTTQKLSERFNFRAYVVDERGLISNHHFKLNAFSL